MFPRLGRRAGAFIVLASLSAALLASPALGARRSTPEPQPSPVAAVLQVQVIPVERAAQMVRALYPHAHIRLDAHANALVVVASQADVDAMRTIVQGIDVKSPTQPAIDIIPLKTLHPATLVARLRPLFPDARLNVASHTSVLVRAPPLEMQQIKTLASTLDTPSATPLATARPVDTVAIRDATPKVLARAVAHAFPDVRISVSGANLLLAGDPDAVSKAKDLAASLDVPGYGARYTKVYHLKNVSAASVGDLITKSYPNVHVSVDGDLNAISVSATAGEHDRIAAAIDQLDGAGTSGQGGGAAYGGDNIAVVQLSAPIPGANDGPSTTAQDIATALTQALGQLAPDLRVTVPANLSEIVLAGSPTSIALAKQIIAKIDVLPPQVVLDTEVLEIDESAAKNLGLQLPPSGAEHHLF